MENQKNENKINDLENRISNLELKINHLIQENQMQLHFLKDDVCHKCHTKMFPVKISKGVASIYKCENEKCTEYNREKLVDDRSLNFLWFLQSHLE